jgi:hypothetical protein
MLILGEATVVSQLAYGLGDAGVPTYDKTRISIGSEILARVETERRRFPD